MTAAYEQENKLLTNDLALLEIDDIIHKTSKQFPEYFWTPRITFTGLLDMISEN